MSPIFNRRAARWIPTTDSVLGKSLIGLGSVILVGGLITAIVTPFVVTASNIKETQTTGNYNSHFHYREDLNFHLIIFYTLSYY